MTTMCATVRQVQCCELLVCDHCTSEEVVVHSDQACHFCVGDQVCICYNGAMTFSVPPQISAARITRMSSRCC